MFAKGPTNVRIMDVLHGHEQSLRSSSSGIKILKLAEGLNNKAFILTMETGPKS